MSEPLTAKDLHTECPACSDEAFWEGEVESREDGLWAIVVCPHGHGYFPVKKPDWQEFLQSWLISP
jgi:hypothetical protein